MTFTFGSAAEDRAFAMTCIQLLIGGGIVSYGIYRVVLWLAQLIHTRRPSRLRW